MRSLLLNVNAVVMMVVLGIASSPIASAEDALQKARQAQTKVDEVQTSHMRQLEELESKTALSKIPLFNQRGDVVRNIKGFWKAVFVNHPSHTNWIHGQDKEILDYLIDFRVDDIGEHQIGFLRHYKITMSFTRENPYFENTEISREIKGIAQGPDTKVSGIKWLGGKKPRGASFFNFFEIASGAAGTDQLHDHIYNDMAHVMRYEFWPNPFSYYDLPTNERFAAEHQANYQAELDRANEGGLPPADETAEKVQNELRNGGTPVRIPNTPVSGDRTPSSEEVLALQAKEAKEAQAIKEEASAKKLMADQKQAEQKKAEQEAAEQKKKKVADKQKMDDEAKAKVTEEKSNKKKKFDKKTRNEKSKSSSNSGSKSASQEAPVSDDDGF